MVHNERLKRRAESSPRDRYFQAREQFSAALHAPEATFNGDTVISAYRDVELRIGAFLSRSPITVATTMRELASQGAREFIRRGQPWNADAMNRHAQRMDDRLHVVKGEYKVVDRSIENVEPHGAPSSSVTVYQRPDGTRFALSESFALYSQDDLREGARKIIAGFVPLHKRALR